MNIYLVDYWLPFPSSEYGGLECVVARNADHCVEILVSRENKYTREAYPNFEQEIQNAVAHATVFTLRGEYEPGVVESFIT